MRQIVFVLALVGCTRAGDPAPAVTTSGPGVAPVPMKTAPAPTSATRVELTSVTLADDCGGTAPIAAPAKSVLKAAPGPAGKAKQDADYAYAKRRCEQTSMQIAIVAGDAATLHVKSVELFDESDKSLGTLTASKPTRWSSTNSAYEAWDEAFLAGETSASYVLSQPPWDHVTDRWNKTYTLKTVLTIGGVDQTAQKDVTLTAPTSLPPNVKT